MKNALEPSFYRITKLKIERFRRLDKQDIELGPHVTLIAGQNGTSKSTLLGLIAFPFNFKSDGDSVYSHHYKDMSRSLEEFQTINSKPFSCNSSQIFRFSRDYDAPNEHHYSICIEGPDIQNPQELREEGIPVRSRPRKVTTQGIRLVAGKTHEKGEGKFSHPLIYLGLGRLAPLAECQKLVVEAQDDTLTKEETELLHGWNDKILALTEKANGVEVIKSGLPSKGAFPAASYRDYNPETYSAGQDNLGQILIALLSFRRLREELGEKYAGGLLLVDELDAALFPHAQEKLLSLLVEQSKELHLQIIATTHSLTMLHYRYHSKDTRDIDVVFLRMLDNRVKARNNMPFRNIQANMKIKFTPPEKPALFFEDEVAISFFMKITQGLFENDYDILNGGTSGVLKGIAENNDLRQRLKAVVVLDPDMSNLKCKRVLFLPARNKACIEKEMYAFLEGLSDADTLWNEDYGFTKQLVFRDFRCDVASNKNTNLVKGWFDDMVKRYTVCCGSGGSLIFEAWCRHNQDLCKEFCKKLAEEIRKLFPDALRLTDIESRLEKVYTPLESEDVSDMPLFSNNWNRGNA